MPADLGTAYVNIVPKAPGISSKIEETLGGGMPGAERAGKGYGKKIIGALAGIGIGKAVGDLFKSAFETGGKLQQSYGGLDTIYGDAAEQAKAYAQAAAAAGISANDYAEQAVSFGAALKSAYNGDTTAAMEAANAALLQMADNSAKMGTDLGAIQNAYQGFAKGNYTMLDNLSLGYGGTQSEMERLIRDAEKLDKTFKVTHTKAKNGADEITYSYADVVRAIGIVQKDLGIAGVAAAEAQTTLTGSAGAMKASWENLMGALATGQGLDTAMRNLSTSVGYFASNVISMIGNIGPQLPDLILGLADVVIANAPAFVSAGAELIVNLAVGLVQRIPDLVAKVPEIWASFKAAFSGIDWASLGSGLMTWIGNGIESLRASLGEKFKGAIESAKNRFSEIDFNAVGYNIVMSVITGIESLLQTLETKIRNVSGSIKRWFTSVDWSTIGLDIISGLVRGLDSGVTWLYNAIRDLITGGMKAAREAGEIGSPSRLFAREVGRWIPAGVAMGAEDNVQPLDRAMQSMMDGSIESAARYSSTAAPADRSSLDADRIIAALQSLKLETVVALKGDARGIFKQVRSTNDDLARARNMNPLGGRV